jgi:hypothetical protein
MKRSISRFARMTVAVMAGLALAGTAAVVQAAPAAASGPCGQSTHLWVYGAETGSVAAGSNLYPTGVVAPSSQAYFQFELVHNPKYPYGPATVIAGHWTRQARGNCVIHHEPELRSTAGWPAGLYRVATRYQRWEDDIIYTNYALLFFDLA